MSELDLWLVPLLMSLLVGVLCPVTGTLLVTQRRVLQANLEATLQGHCCFRWGPHDRSVLTL